MLIKRKFQYQVLEHLSTVYFAALEYNGPCPKMGQMKSNATMETIPGRARIHLSRIANPKLNLLVVISGSAIRVVTKPEMKGRSIIKDSLLIG